MATSGSWDSETRRRQILEIIHGDGRLRLDDASERLGVSAMTIRRDLDQLEAEGLVRRVRGGAVAAPLARSFADRLASDAGAKRAIARKAAALLPSGGAVAFDASSTVATLARELAPTAALTVVTNSYDTFSMLERSPQVTPLLVGGEREKSTGSFVGLIACEGARAAAYRVFFVSASAVSGQGSSEVSFAEAQVKRAFAAASEKVALCVGSAKLGQAAIAVALDWERIDVLITELEPDAPALDPFRDLADIR